MVDYDEFKANSPSFGDFNRDGRIDFARRVMDVNSGPGKWLVQIYLNETQTANTSFTIELLGKNGERNQQSRTVKIHPVSRPDFLLTRLVDGGSGYLNQNQYPILVGTPFNEEHRGKAHFALTTVDFVVSPGELVRVYADGRVEREPYELP